MLHPADIEHKLGFDQIREMLKANCLCTLGTGRVDALTFNTSEEDIRRLLKETLEFRQILEQNENFPAKNYFDPTALLATAAVEGSYLEPIDFLNIKRSMETIIACRNFLVKFKGNFPVLAECAGQVTVNQQLVKEISQVIDDDGQVRDTASAELKRIRKLLREAHLRVRAQIDKAFRLAVSEQWVPEGGLPVIRQGKLAIPVLAEHKRKLKGYILDESATGQTVYIEPVEVLEANNEIRDLDYAAQREVVKLLKNLTSGLRNQLDELQSAYRFLAHIDFTRAKAKLAMAMDASFPVLEKSPMLNWVNARHPLLQFGLAGKRNVVPLTISLTDSERMLLISGPNAGGKSVCLKTVGLLQYMLQCGLLIPVFEDSIAGIFEDLFIDIGDQQSIENDLSTYSSHLKNLVTFIEHGGERSLVLLDELGSGTDPNFGGAIAEAVLEALLNNKVWTVATTHYYNLKLFAGKHPGIRNGAMRFDEEKLAPLFILDIGKPGSSFALEIARKTGMAERVLKKAEELIGKDLLGFDRLVRNLERDRQEATERLARLEKQQQALEELQKHYQRLLSDLERNKKEILDQAKAEAAELLRHTNREIEKTIRHIRENQAQRNETAKVRKNLHEISRKVNQKRAVRAAVVTESIKAGDRVSIIGQEGSGTVVSLKGRHAIVQFGEMKSKVELVKLTKVTGSGTVRGGEGSANIRVGIGLNLHEKQAVFNPLLDVRGKRAEEVIPLLEQFLDTAVLLGYRELKIMHGKGEGILRSVVRNELPKHNQVASFADDHVDRGGAGITVVVLK
jgi:DNA mismatch repair protein MutS2